MMEQLKQLVDKHEYISFDIFDTLLLRNIYHPTDIFKIMDKKIKNEYDIDNFYQLRIDSERNARTKVENGECTFDEIYSEMSNIFNNKQLEDIKNMELDLEYEFITVNPFMKEIFDYAYDNNKKIYLISDMYLSKDAITRLLSKANYREVDLYVSCEKRLNKGTGTLFEYVGKENNLDRSKWLHIGDNSYSDYQMPISLGIDAYNYKNVKEYDKSYIPQTIEESIITAIQFNNIYNGKEVNYWEKFGILNISPFYFGFSFWLYNLTKDKDNLFFLARDGYIFDKIYKLFPKTNTFTNYIYGSRKSIQIPSLYDCSTDYLTYMLTIKNDVVDSTIHLKDMFKTAELDYTNEKYLPIIRLFGFKSFDDVVNDKNYDDAKKLISSQIDDIKENLKPQRDLAIKYLNEEGMKNFDKINIVDVGWAGSIQYSIKKLLAKEVNGYYFGTINSNKTNAYSTMFGYYFDLDKKEEDKDEIINNIMMYELIFSAPHGTTSGYEEVNKKVKPILLPDDNNKIVETFQESALNTIKQYLEYYKYFEYVDKYFCTSRYRKFISEQNYDDMAHFAELSNDLVLGSDEKYPYVIRFKKDFVNKNYHKFNLLRSKSIWKNAYTIEDASKEEIENIVKKINRKNILKAKIKNFGRKFVPFGIRKVLLKIYRKNAK